MKLINILRYTRGYVKFTIYGGFRERFINLCNVKSIRIWNVIPEIDRIHACVSIKNFHRLRSIVRESGVTLKAEEKKGLPLFLKKYRHRAVLMIGILLVLVFYAVMNRFIWFIEVEGTDTVSHEEIINVMSDYGLKIGAYAPSVDEISVSRSAVNYFNGRLLWISVNIKGSKAVIEVRDYIDEHEDTTFGDPCNIIADFDGTVLSIETFNGDREIKPGSAVKKGDLLISGVIQNRDMSASYLEARGRITAHHNLQFTQRYSNKSNCIRYTGVKEKKYLNIIGLEIPAYFSKSSHTFAYSEFLTINDKKLPFGLICKTEYTECEATDKPGLIYAVDAYIADYYRSFANTNILDCKMSVKCSGKDYTISSDMSCIDFMGVKSKIVVE